MRIYLNLLPPHKKKALQKVRILAFFQTVSLVVLLVAASIISTLILVRGQLQASYHDLQQRSTTASAEEATDIISDIKQTNLYLQEIDAASKLFVPWSEAVRNIAALIPPNTRLEKMEIDSTGKVRLLGIAATREGALELLQRLNETPYLTDIVSPLSNILQKENVNFDINMTYSTPQPATGE